MAGEFGTWQLVYTVGTAGLATGGTVRIVTDSDTDWGWPQVDDPSGPEYMTATYPPEAELALVIPDHITIELINTGRALAPGETVVRHLRRPVRRRAGFPRPDLPREPAGTSGSRSTPPGRAPSRTCRTCRSCRSREGSADRLIVVAPSTAVAGEEFRVGVKAEDRWGNPASAYRGTVALAAAGIRLGESEMRFDEDDGGGGVDRPLQRHRGRRAPHIGQGRRLGARRAEQSNRRIGGRSAATASTGATPMEDRWSTRARSATSSPTRGMSRASTSRAFNATTT